MKEIVVAMMAAALAGGPVQAYAGAMAVIDVKAIVEMKNQVVELKKQYDAIKQQYTAITGSYGRGSFGLADAIVSSSVVPGSWQEVVWQQAKGAYNSKQVDVEKLINTLPQDLFLDPKGQDAKTYKLSTDSVRAALAGGDALFSQVQTHLNNLAKLGQQVDATVNLKDAQDLHNRIATESGMLQSALAKMNSLNMNLQANLVNQQNQAIAANARYYQWKK